MKSQKLKQKSLSLLLSASMQFGMETDDDLALSTGRDPDSINCITIIPGSEPRATLPLGVSDGYC